MVSSITEKMTETNNGFVAEALKTFLAKDNKEKEEADKKLVEYLNTFLGHILEALKDNGGKFLVGDGLTAADISVANMVTYLEMVFGQGWCKEHPEMCRYVESILGTPKIKKWVESRPVTEY